MQKGQHYYPSQSEWQLGVFSKILGGIEKTVGIELILYHAFK
ncbi:hypothetical protein P872_04300 [Rhodonellum psychrophilum GCM71 = DSM 17998]|uniref:Uncharacterized protein n=1 Tax=Rhodonellum psychrophilum GCM71 = DSM 17998 TaxID=1123057 RepID=U5BYU5_9BACT|nr:hypothetical protein P872_04300 [Rhodonellum psychrophilum GCM71 = DSM 17998]